VGLPLTLVALQTARAKGKVVSSIILVLSAITIAKSQSRGAFVGLVVVGVGTLLTLRGVPIMRRIAVLGIATAALVLTAPSGYWDLVNTLRDPTSDYNWDSPNGRREVAKRGVGYMLQYPIFGIGIHNFGRAEGTISTKARHHVAGTGLRWVAPHNSFVEVGAELGVPGLVLWSSLVFGGMITMYRAHRRLPANWRSGDSEQRFVFWLTAGLPIALAGFAVTSFFVSFAFLDPIYILAAMVCGVYVTVENRLATLQDVHPRLGRRSERVARGVAAGGGRFRAEGRRGR
jgi:O-antigen ligase